MSFKTSEKFHRVEGGCAELADNDAGCVIGDFGGFLQGASGTDRKSKEGDGRISRTGNIKNFPRSRGCVIGRLVL